MAKAAPELIAPQNARPMTKSESTSQAKQASIANPLRPADVLPARPAVMETETLGNVQAVSVEQDKVAARSNPLR